MCFEQTNNVRRTVKQLQTTYYHKVYIYITSRFAQITRMYYATQMLASLAKTEIRIRASGLQNDARLQQKQVAMISPLMDSEKCSVEHVLLFPSVDV